MTPRQVWDLLKHSAAKWSKHNVPKLGASLAFYWLLSMAPLLVLAVAICGLVVNKNAAESDLLRQLQALAGPSAAKTAKMLLDNAHHSSGGRAATVALLTLFFGASGVFLELKDSLNIIWDVPSGASSSWRSIVWQRIVSFGMVLAVGFLLLVSLLLTTALAVAQNFFTGLIPLNAAILSEVANFVISVAALAALFALIFKFVPDVPIAWSDVAVGAIVSAILFNIGKGLLALYLGTAAVGSAYGAAGSLVAFAVWVYYSAQIFFFGAVFTRAYADCCGSHARRQRRVNPLTASAPAFGG